MSINSVHQLETTHAKLALLEQRINVLKAEPTTNSRTRELSRRSLQQLINDLREEIARFHALAAPRP